MKIKEGIIFSDVSPFDGKVDEKLRFIPFLVKGNKMVHIGDFAVQIDQIQIILHAVAHDIGKL